MFALDSRLAGDTYVLGEFPLSRLLLMNDAQYPWFILVPRREAVSEVFDLEALEQQQLWQETLLLAERLKSIFATDKINIATLGNVVAQLHMHVIVRRKNDPAWPAPVWGKHPAQPYTPEQLATLRGQLNQALGDLLEMPREVL